jgi:hypothetical protein
MRIPTGLFAKLVVLVVGVLILSVLSCSGVQNNGTAPELVTIDSSVDRTTQGPGPGPGGSDGSGGNIVPGIHDDHLNAGLSCMDCHSMHSGLMPTKETCLGCHTLEAPHKHASKIKECTDCHKS